MVDAQREARLALCRRLLLVVGVAAALPKPEAVLLEPAQPRCCPNCGSLRQQGLSGKSSYLGQEPSSSVLALVEGDVSVKRFGHRPC